MQISIEGILEEGETRLYECEETDVKNRTEFKAQRFRILSSLSTRSMGMLIKKTNST